MSDDQCPEDRGYIATTPGMYVLLLTWVTSRENGLVDMTGLETAVTHDRQEHRLLATSSADNVARSPSRLLHHHRG